MSGSTVYIDFAVRGMKDVDRAFKNVMDSIAGYDSRLTARTSQAAQKREQLARREVTSREREFAKLARTTERWHREEVREADRTARAKERAAAKAADAEIKATEKAVQAHERASQRKASASERAAERSLRALQRELAAEERAAKKKADHDSHQRADRREMLTRAMGRDVVNAALGTGTAMMGAAHSLMAIGSGFSVEDSIRRDVKLRGRASDLANAATQSGEARRDPGAILGNVKATAAEFGMDQGDVLGGLEKFTALTGDLDKGMALMGSLAQMARATGSSFEDLASSAGEVFNADKKASAETMIGVMRALAAQGKLGAVEISDLAKDFAALGSAATGFGGETATKIGQMNALAQISKGQVITKNAVQATNAVEALGASFSKNARLDAFEAAGVAVDDKATGRRRDAKSIIFDAIVTSEKRGHGLGSGFDRQMGAMFADKKARQATLGLEKIYKEAGGGAAGLAAMKTEFSRFEGATMTGDEERKAAMARVAEADVQLEVATQQLRDAFAKELTPALIEFLPHLRELAGPAGDVARSLGKLASFVANHPWAAAFSALGLNITAAITKEVVAARIGDTIKGLLSGGSGPGMPGGTAAGGAAMSGLQMGLATAAVVYNSGQKFADGSMAADDMAAKVDAWKRGDKERGVSPEAAMQVVEAAKARVGKASALDMAENLLFSPISESSSKAYSQYKADQALVDSKALSDAIASALVQGAQKAAPSLAAHPDVPNRNASMAQRGGAQ